MTGTDFLLSYKIKCWGFWCVGEYFRTDIWNHCRFIPDDLNALCLYYQTAFDHQTVDVLCWFPPQNPTLLNDDWNGKPWRRPVLIPQMSVFRLAVKWDVKPFCDQTFPINSWSLKTLEKRSNAPDWIHFCTSVNLERSTLEYHKLNLFEIKLRHVQNLRPPLINGYGGILVMNGWVSNQRQHIQRND